MPDALDALQAQIRACRRCALAHPVAPVVQGSRGARIMLIGQAPGKTEHGSGRPWTGPAGRRLMRWMTESVGFASPEAFRAQVYLAAVTRCYPGPSPRGKGDRKPSPAEIAECSPFLARELELVRPALIVLVGGMAVERFLGKLKLEAVVGRVLPMDFGAFSTLVVALPHPSGASTWLNEPSNQAQLARGLAAMREVIASGALAELGAEP